ncbi:hypothetical protein [Candidatus Sororendozoicomonas aggregata]|uniref:hypothetical protein n=1 Tax=Candidatus Sororendozoicomonas aggregata TaxID=3073239 RepID=UPI002ED0742B
MVTATKTDNIKPLIDRLNRCESNLRELEGQTQSQQERVLALLKEHPEEQLLDIFQLSSQPDYRLTHQLMCQLWSFKEKSEGEVIPAGAAKQAMCTIQYVSQEIIDNWPALTPKKVSRLGILIKGAANIASEK